MTDPILMQRRDAIKALLAISASGALAACGAGTEGQERFKAAMAASKLDESEMAFLSAIAQTIIPKTDTAGAIEAGVPDVLQTLFREWGDDNYRVYWKTGTQDLMAKVRAESGQDYVDLSTEAQTEWLAAYDAKAYEYGDDEKFYRDMKSTVATAYYMSEPGATEELAYEAVPGEWRGCVPLSEQPRTWAT